ncbi:MAG: hypothetical protein ABSE51_13440 [Terracidiphilus sp.]
MPTPRLIFAAFLTVTPMLCAQEAQTHDAQTQKAEINAAPASHAANSSKASRPAFEPLQLTVTFRRTRGGKITTYKTYTLAASAQQWDPQIRDDSRVPMKKETSATGSQTDYANSNTDVDIHNIREVGDLVSLTLRIATEGYSELSPLEHPGANSSLGSHQYTISPTVPTGKLTPVYSMQDDVNDYKVEVLLLVQPLNVK